MKRLLKLILIRAKCTLYHAKRVSLHNTCNIGSSSVFEGYNKVGKKSSFYGYLGLGSYIGERCSVIGEVGRFTSIGDDVKVLTGTHPYTYPYVSTSPCFVSPMKQNNLSFNNDSGFCEFLKTGGSGRNHVYKGAVIGNDCWICSNAIILGNVTINDGAVVLSGSIVTKDVPAYSVVGGNPAKIVKYRYSDEDINILIRTGWWNKGLAWIKEHSECFLNFDKFRDL